MVEPVKPTSAEIVQPTSSESFRTLVEWLVTHRHYLAVVYVLVMGWLLGVSYLIGPDIYANVPQVLLTGRIAHDVHIAELKSPILRGMLIVSYLFAQLVFVWGIGKVKASPTPKRRMAPLAVTGLIGGGMFACLSYAALAVVLELFNVSHRRIWIFSPDTIVSFAITFFAIAWLLWLVVIVLYIRKRESSLGRLVAVLLAGSWVEFTVALGVDVSVRQQRATCLCYTGSWLALVISVPLLFWTVGPSIFLLYAHEKANGTEMRRRQILWLKTKWERARPKRRGSKPASEGERTA